MKQNIRKLSILLFLVSLFISCSPEENFVKNKTAISLQDIKTKQINYNDFSRKTQYVKNKPDISPMISENQMARLATDTSDYVIYSDRIIETIFNDYTSYTMLLKTPNTTKYVYYNIVLEVRNNTTEVLILKYTKTESGILEETITAFRSPVDDTPPSGGSIELKEFIDGFDNLGGGGSGGTSTSGSGGMPWTGLGGSPIYPSNCNGTVTTTYVLEPKKCSENIHWPPTQCNAAQWAYYELVPYYSCVPNPSTGTTNPPTSGGGNIGGGGNNTDPQEDTSITAMIKPIECTERLEGDLNGDCQLSTYESCLKDGNSQEVCDCVNAGGKLIDCIKDDLCDQLKKIANSPNFTDRIAYLKTKAAGPKEHAWAYKYFSGTNNFAPPTVVGHNTSNPNKVYLEAFLGSEWLGAFHNHTNGENPTIKMFSPGDLEWLFLKAVKKNNHQPPSVTSAGINELFLGLVNINEVYCLKIKDWNKFHTLINTAIFDKFEKELLKKYHLRDSNTSQIQLQEDFLKSLKKYDLGVGLYEQDANGNWSEINLDATNNNPVKTPCP